MWDMANEWKRPEQTWGEIKFFKYIEGKTRMDRVHNIVVRK